MVLPPDVTESVAVFSPSVVYVLLTDALVPDSESVPLHEYVYEPVPPVAEELHESD